MATVLQNVCDDTVLLYVSHSNLKHHFSEVKFSLHSTVGATKERLWKNCGTTVDSMVVQPFDDNDKRVCDMNEDLQPLGFYSPRDGYRIHIVDMDPLSMKTGGRVKDTSLVEKYHISEESYGKLDGTFRKFKERLNFSEDMESNLYRTFALLKARGMVKSGDLVIVVSDMLQSITLPRFAI